MGNRAVIAQLDQKYSLYVHWNGGRNSIEGFLEVYRDLGYPPFAAGRLDTLPRLAQVCRNYFGPDGLSVGIGLASTQGMETGPLPTVMGFSFLDNGYYLVDGYGIAFHSLPYEGYEEDTDGPSNDFVGYVRYRQPENRFPASPGKKVLVTARDSELCMLISDVNIALAACKLCRVHKFRPPNEDEYGWACLAQVVGNYDSSEVLFGTKEDVDPDGRFETVDVTNWQCTQEPDTTTLLYMNLAQPPGMAFLDVKALVKRRPS